MLDPARSRLYVAGTNVLYQLDDALRVSHKVETGPVLDSHECSATECSNGPTTKVDTDNHAKVLVLDARSDRLLLCGSVRQGACYRHSPTDFTANTEQLLTAVASNTVAIVGTQAGTVIKVLLADGEATVVDSFVAA